LLPLGSKATNEFTAGQVCAIQQKATASVVDFLRYRGVRDIDQCLNEQGNPSRLIVAPGWHGTGSLNLLLTGVGAIRWRQWRLQTLKLLRNTDNELSVPPREFFVGLETLQLEPVVGRSCRFVDWYRGENPSRTKE
jgi:hypothetical protein